MIIYISFEQSRMNVDVVRDLLKQTPWAATRTRETVEKSMKNSICFGAFAGPKQIGFARVVTDGCTFCYLCDVIVDEKYRGQGISRKIMEAVMTHPELQSYRRFTLATVKSHGLYRKFGFQDVPPNSFMEIKRDGI